MSDGSSENVVTPGRAKGQNGDRSKVTTRAVHSLKQRLAQGEWTAGDRLPSEPALAEDLGVSRVTVRGALAQLEAEGIVTRRHGSGTYVNSVRPLVSSLHLNMGAEQMIRSSGHVPGISEMTWRQIEATEEIAEQLGIDVGAQVVHLYRVRTADGVPVTVSCDYFPASFLPEQTPTMGPSLYSFLSQVCGKEVSFGIATLKPTLAGDAHAAALGAQSDDLCLAVRQVDYDAAEQPISYSIEHHLASALTFQLVRQGPHTVPLRRA